MKRDIILDGVRFQFDDAENVDNVRLQSVCRCVLTGFDEHLEEPIARWATITPPPGDKVLARSVFRGDHPELGQPYILVNEILMPLMHYPIIVDFVVLHELCHFASKAKHNTAEFITTLLRAGHNLSWHPFVGNRLPPSENEKVFK